MVGMKDKSKGKKVLSPAEMRIIDGLRRNPLMRERIQSILDLADNAGPLKTADEIEELLIEEVRKLGNTTMHQWASQAEERVGREVKNEDNSALHRKKKR